jgi:hypothetical protein
MCVTHHTGRGAGVARLDFDLDVILLCPFVLHVWRMGGGGGLSKCVCVCVWVGVCVPAASGGLCAADGPSRRQRAT